LTGQQEAPRQRGASSPILSLIWRLIALAFIDAVALLLAYAFFGGGLGLAAIILLAITAAINVIFLVDRLYPLRWISPGLLLLVLMVVYPFVYTVYVATTNFSSTNVLAKEQVVERLEQQFYTPEGSESLSWRAYRSPDGDFLILLADPSGRQLVGDPAQGVIPLDEYQATFGPIDPADNLPTSIDDHVKLSRGESVRYLTALSQLVITDAEAQLRIVSLDRAELGRQRFVYDPATDSMTDQQTGTVYRAEGGFFVAADGTRAPAPGFVQVIGLDNFFRVVTDRRISGAFFGVFTWTFTFALLSVLTTFALGLALALVFNDQRLPLKGLFRTLAIIPYTVPGFISALVWVGLLNPNFGPINGFLRDFVGVNPQWFSDGTLAKIAILLVNTWLGYPYMLIVALGALQSIPGDLYEAAEIDGASPWQRFSTITLPLLLVALAPLLIGSFAFNFNNFTLIDLVTEGGPPTPGAVTPAGQTDILISYSFRLAFSGGRGQDYAFAAAISIFIFAIVAAITIFNFRLSRRLENLTG